MKSIETHVKNNQSRSIFLSEEGKSHYKHKELGVNIIYNGYVLPFREWDYTGAIADGGVVDEHGQYVKGTSFGWDKESAVYDINKKNIDVSNECIFLGYFHAVYGHAITDALKKLWYFHTEECKSLIKKGVEVIYLTTSNTEMPTWHLHLFELAGVSMSTCKHIRKITKYRKIIIPDSSWWRQNNGIIEYNDGFRMVVNKIKENVKKTYEYSSTTPSNIYFTRTAIRDVWRELGESALEAFFKKIGFAVFSPEKYTLEHQISMLMKCKKFAATEGSCSHAQLFCSSDAEVFILRKADYINCYTTAIADFTDCKTVFIDANHSILTKRRAPWRGPFYLTVTEELRQCFGVNGGLPVFLRPTYWLYKYQNRLFGKQLLYLYYLLLIVRYKISHK